MWLVLSSLFLIVSSLFLVLSSLLVLVSSLFLVLSSLFLLCLLCLCWFLSGWCCLPVWWWYLPVWWWCLVPRQHIAAGAPSGYARQLLSAAGSLASESKLQGKIDRCDYSYYQLFRCSFWVCFYIAVYRLKY